MSDRLQAPFIRFLDSPKMNQLVLYSCLIAIILLSFFTYSYAYYSALNSDHAIIVLMTYYYSPIDCVYFWGQDRIGGFIPLLSQPLFKAGLSAVMAVSIVQYSVLILGYFALASFFEKKLVKLLIAIAWFLPPTHFIDFLLLYTGIAYSLIFCGAYFLSKADNALHCMKKSSFIFNVLFGFICFALSIWVSDLSLITMSLLLLCKIVFVFTKKNGPISSSIFHILLLYGFLFSAAIGMIRYFKSLASLRTDYSILNTQDQFLEALKILFQSIRQLLVFEAKEPFTSVFIYSIVLLFLFLIAKKVISIRSLFSRHYFTLFLFLDIGALMGVVVITHWSLLNGIPRRYFVSAYIGCSLFLAMAFENLNTGEKKSMVYRFFALTIFLIGGLGGLYHLEKIWPRTMRAKITDVAEFDSLGEIGLIGSYWNSYLYSTVSPDKVIATPYDPSVVRNNEINERVFQEKNIYLIRDGWMDNYPDSLFVQDHLLYKTGQEFKLGDANLCKYEAK